PTGRIGWDVIAPKPWPCCQLETRRPTLWKRRSVEKSKNRLSHRAWKSRQPRGIPTFPQRRRRLDEIQQPDISLATRTGHFNLLRTEYSWQLVEFDRKFTRMIGSFAAASQRFSVSNSSREILVQQQPSSQISPRALAFLG